MVKQLEDEIKKNYTNTFNLSVKEIYGALVIQEILNEIKTKPTWGKNQLKDLFLEKILKNL